MAALLAFPLIVMGIIALLFATVIEKFLPYVVIGAILYTDLLIYLFIIKPLLESMKKFRNVIGWIFILILTSVNIFAGVCGYYYFKEERIPSGYTQIDAKSITDDNIKYRILIKEGTNNKDQKIQIKEFLYDEQSKERKLLSKEKGHFLYANVGKTSKEKYLVPCYIEYRIEIPDGKFNDKIMRIGLLNEKEIPVKEKNREPYTVRNIGSLDDLVSRKNFPLDYNVYAEFY